MSDENDFAPKYSGRGWNFVNLRALAEAPGWLAAPIVVMLALLVLSIVGALLVRSFQALIFGAADDVYKILLTLAGAVGVPFVAWRTLVAHQQTGIARESHYTPLFTRAVEQLGATREVVGANGERRTEPNLEVRLGAIYVLDRIARDSERDHWPIMEVLCAYIRSPQNTGNFIEFKDTGGGSTPTWTEEVPPLRVDAQAALTVIGNRPRFRQEYERSRAYRLDLTYANLQNAKFSGDFSYARFDSARLELAHFRDCTLIEADFSDAYLDFATFYHSKLKDVTFGFPHPGIRFSNAFGCEISQIINAHFIRGNFSDCDFKGARFATSSFRDVDFWHSDFSRAQLDSVQFVNCGFLDVTFDGARAKDLTFEASEHLSQVALASMVADGATNTPEGFTRPDTWLPYGHSEDIPF